MLQVTKWLAVVAVVITLMQTIALPANALITIPPGQDFVGPICPQIEVSATPGCYPDEFGVYSIEVIPLGPITNRNFVPCAPGDIDSYFLFGGSQLKITNIGYIPIEFTPVCD